MLYPILRMEFKVPEGASSFSVGTPVITAIVSDTNRDPKTTVRKTRASLFRYPAKSVNDLVVCLGVIHL